MSLCLYCNKEIKIIRNRDKEKRFCNRSSIKLNRKHSKFISLLDR